MASAVRPLTGLATIVVIAGVVAGAIALFRGDLTPTVPVTLLSPRAGLVMNPDAKVKMRGVQVGKVASIEERPDGQAAIQLAMDPSQLHLIPANVLVDIASTTVFGSKFVQLVPPADPSAQPMYAGQVLDGRHVTVEINTVFQQLTQVLGSIQPEKLNETLGAIATAFNGRGEKFGQLLSDFDALLVKLDPSLPALGHDLQVLPAVVNAYADAAPDLIKAAGNATRVSQTIVDEQQNLDALLVSTIGLADIGNDVIGTNRAPLTDALHLLLPTTSLLNQYNASLACGLAGIVPLSKAPPLPDPGVAVSVSFTLGVERYRYPKNLPKVAAVGGEDQCATQMLPHMPYEGRPPFLVTDVGANPWQYGNQGILLNSDALKQALYGPVDGPPRNTSQIGEPG
jgi:phospholipid/cholesterol/gamma-HCH transport system substrate-binding protein